MTPPTGSTAKKVRLLGRRALFFRFCFVHPGDGAVCHREEGAGQGGGPPSSFMHTTESASRARLFISLTKKHKNRFCTYILLCTHVCLFVCFYRWKSQKYRKIKCFIITGRFFFLSLCLFSFFSPRSLVETGSLRLSGLWPLSTPLCSLPSSLASLSRGSSSSPCVIFLKLVLLSLFAVFICDVHQY